MRSRGTVPYKTTPAGQGGCCAVTPCRGVVNVDFHHHFTSLLLPAQAPSGLRHKKLSKEAGNE